MKTTSHPVEPSDSAATVKHPLFPCISALPPWDMYTVASALFSGYILLPLLISNIVTLIDPFLSLSVQIFIQQGTTLLTWVAIFGYLRWRYGPLGKFLGFSLQKPFSYYLWEAVKLILLTFGLTLAMNYFWSTQHLKNPGTEPYQDATMSELFMLSFFAVVMAPLLEEIIFRGLVQSTFHKFSSPVMSIVLSCLVFLSLHGSYFENIRALAHVLVLGLCFGIWRERTQSLLPGIFAHLCNNGLASILLLYYHVQTK